MLFTTRFYMHHSHYLLISNLNTIFSAFCFADFMFVIFKFNFC